MAFRVRMRSACARLRVPCLGGRAAGAHGGRHGFRSGSLTKRLRTTRCCSGAACACTRRHVQVVLLIPARVQGITATWQDLTLTRTLILLESRAGRSAHCNLSRIRLGRTHYCHGATTGCTDDNSCTRACTFREAQTGGGGAFVTSCPCAMFATSHLQAARIWLMPLPRHSSTCHHIRCGCCQRSRVVLCKQQRAAKATSKHSFPVRN